MGKEFEIGDGIRRLRSIRRRFLTDSSVEAYDNTARMIEAFWPLRAGQIDQEKFHPHLYRPDPKAEDQDNEQKKRLWSALLAKLALPVWGYSTTPTDRESRIAEIESDMRAMMKDGLLPHERAQGTERSISAETLRHNVGLLPKQREQLFEDGLEPAGLRIKSAGRQWKNEIDEARLYRKMPFIRSREKWRVSEVYAACKALHDVALWIAEQDRRPNDDPERLIPLFEERYRLADLVTSRANYAPSDHASRLAIAIGSASHLATGTDDYEPDDTLALSMLMHYGQFLRDIRKRSRTK